MIIYSDDKSSNRVLESMRHPFCRPLPQPLAVVVLHQTIHCGCSVLCNVHFGQQKVVCWGKREFKRKTSFKRLAN